ncbi:MAG TPA: cation transporter, partial [Bacteroidales bacterium]|nr:cation transporter [Bacteroidales bacterium]
LGFVAFEFIQSSIIKLKNREMAVFGALAIIATVTSIILKEGLAQYAFYTWKKTGYLSLKADAWHHRSDAISSVIVLIGIFLGSITGGLMAFSVFSLH